MKRLSVILFFAVLSNALAQQSWADPPVAEYIFPAGGQRGTTVKARIGGDNLHESPMLHLIGSGVTGPKQLSRIQTVYFEGPVIPQPASQRKENYPKDYAANLKIAKNAQPGVRSLRLSNSQGMTSALKFLVGDLPEVVEQEIDGAPIPTQVQLPVTINGRIFPREDIDIWTFDAKAGQTITCDVVAARLGSPLDSRIEVRGPDGRPIAENVDAVGTDSRLSFRVAQTGRHEIRIHDVNFQGLQNYVYRLTLTAGPYVTAVYPLGGRRGTSVAFELAGANLPHKPVTVTLPRTGNRLHEQQFSTSAGKSNTARIELSDLPEFTETKDKQPAIQFPAVLNGRIAKPGEFDEWKFTAKKGDQFTLDVKAARLGSPLDSVLTVVNSDGKQIDTNDDIGKGQTDSQLALKIPADGEYTIRVEERLKSRGGPRFAYRLWVTQAQPSLFRVTLPVDAITVDTNTPAKIRLNVERYGKFKDAIELKAIGLPDGVTMEGTKIRKNGRRANLTFTAGENATIGSTNITIVATAMVDGKEVTSKVVRPGSGGEPDVSELWFSVAIATPFKFTAEFESKYAPQGSTFYRHYKLERNGFKGPITIKPADVQARHLQGMTGPTIVIPPGQDEFDYPVTVAPWTVIGRTSRTCIMAVGVVTDKAGKKHTVCYSSQAQNDQTILLVDPARLSVRCTQRSIALQPGKTIELPIEVGRGNGLAGPVTVELITAKHITGVSAKSIVIPKAKSRGTMRLTFAVKNCGPFNMPLIIRATLNKGTKSPHFNETLLPVVVDGKPAPLTYYQSRR